MLTSGDSRNLDNKCSVVLQTQDQILAQEKDDNGKTDGIHIKPVVSVNNDTTMFLCLNLINITVTEDNSIRRT